MSTPAHDPDTIPPGWGAHVGDGEWAYRCREAACGVLLRRQGGPVFPVDIQRHLWDEHQVVAPILSSKENP